MSHGPDHIARMTARRPHPNHLPFVSPGKAGLGARAWLDGAENCVFENRNSLGRSMASRLRGFLLKILLPFFGKLWFYLRIPPRCRGRIAIVTTREAGMRWTCWSRRTSEADTDGKGVWSWPPDAEAKRAR
jgi:hypothetical protein